MDPKELLLRSIRSKSKTNKKKTVAKPPLNIPKSILAEPDSKDLPLTNGIASARNIQQLKIDGRQLTDTIATTKGNSKIPVIAFKPITDFPDHGLDDVVVSARSSTSNSGTADSKLGDKPNHVGRCTCPKCKKAKALVKNAPFVPSFKASIKLVERTLELNGLRKTNGEDWNVCWISNSAPLSLFQGLSSKQKVNQFPRTYEITRKDALTRNITKMRETYGKNNFDFLPESFVLPQERILFEETIKKLSQKEETKTIYEKRGSDASSSPLWIVKPSNAACGRGIYVTSNIADIPTAGEEGNVCVSRYIANPMLLDGRKFDLRIYVAVTSFLPLRIYIFDEGLVRLTTEQYSNDPEALANKFVHLTNYSVQKFSEKFVQNNESEEDQASNGRESAEAKSKWTLATFRRRLEAMNISHEKLFQEIENVCVKTIISIEPQVVTAMQMNVSQPENLFQVFGFDILIDEALKPWLLEVNLSPSLSCDSKLDLNIKSSMIAELLTLSGVQPVPIKKNGTSIIPSFGASSSKDLYQSSKTVPSKLVKQAVNSLRAEETRMKRFHRIYPTETSFAFSKFFQDPRPLNDAVIQELGGATNHSNRKRILKSMSSSSNKILPTTAV